MDEYELIKFLEENLTIEISEKTKRDYYTSNWTEVTVALFLKGQKISESSCDVAHHH